MCLYLFFYLCSYLIIENNSENCCFQLGHELKGLKGYFGWFFNRGSVGTVSFPLTTIIDFKGYRITAMTKLPINGSETLVYGSDNAGTECHVRNLMPGKILRREIISNRVSNFWWLFFGGKCVFQIFFGCSLAGKDSQIVFEVWFEKWFQVLFEV